jgi:adenosylhomocysteine nucleosidase
MKIGIMSAMTEEIEKLMSEMKSDQISQVGMRNYHEGVLWGIPTVLVFSHWGKVAAATTATQLISQFQVDEIIFTGVAGGAAPHLQIGDVVIGTDLYQHDMDARPIFAQHEIPLIGKTALKTDEKRSQLLFLAAEQFLKEGFFSAISEENRKEFFLTKPKVTYGAIASGDKFFAKKAELEELQSRLPDVFCVEMEGAAVAQVCHDYQIPFSILRTLSDTAKFIRAVASTYSHQIIRELFLMKRT